MLVAAASYVKLAFQAVAVLVVSVLGINIARGVLKHHSKRRILRGIRGPARQSWFTGNFLELFDPVAGLSYFESLSTYGGIAKIHGLFGVRQT